ncbi:uncharacterized protein N7483_012951 [Penicillium malachiteum]|uniref:uncharacterized protein n=1 Tax=Penicillium malachiteum TaxID=1324776 RepID=UPI0025487F89|nr:uncharacterized protein N7483_012951 [Penicillium malachiteum]KAJ5715770.1 hypothetical protein N7483_012951 [Penicillium malachiteum]
MYLDPTQSLLWAKFLQWETLETLSLVNGEWGELVPSLANRLTRLKSFEVSLSESYPKLRYWWEFDGKLDLPPLYWKRATQVRRLIESMPLLESFSGYFVPPSILDTLSKVHRESLKHLRFRSVRRGHQTPNEGPLPSSIENPENLPDRFPNLQTLGLDLDWTDQEWPFETMTYIRGLKHLKHLEINISSVISSRKPDLGVLGVNKMDDNACKRLVRFFESTPDNISLGSLHIKIGEWENAKWSSRARYPRNGPLIIGERDHSGSMHFYRVNPPIRHKAPLENRLKPYARDIYRSLLEIHGFDDPGFMESDKVARGISDSGWATSS